MSTGVRFLLAAACLAAGALGATARGQQPALPATPAPVPPPGSALPPPILGQPLPLSQPTPPATALPPVLPPPLAPVVAPPPAPGPALVPDAGRDGWANIGLPAKPEGLFFSTEIGILKPSVKNQLSATVTFANGMTDVVSVPQSDLDWVGSSRFEVGYHVADGLGDLIFGYRFLVSEGQDNLQANFGAASVKSRLDINQFDLDYATATFMPLPRYDLRFRIGARLAAVYLDSQATGPFETQQASNYYLGAGPSATIDFERRFRELSDFRELANLGLFARLDGAVLTGQVRQKYRESLFDGLGNEADAFLSQQKTQTSEVLTLQAGLIYHPCGIGNDRLRITGGYQFERWWGIGKLNGANAEITAQGIFLRGEYDF